MSVQRYLDSFVRQRRSVHVMDQPSPCDNYSTPDLGVTDSRPRVYNVLYRYRLL